MSAVTHR